MVFGLTLAFAYQVSDFLNAFTRALSGYYGPAGVRILLATKEGADGSAPPSDAASVAAMHARVHLCTAFRQARRCCAVAGMRSLVRVS